MSSIPYPVVCPDHRGETLTDDATLASHHTASHGGEPIGDYQDRLRPGRTETGAGPAPPSASFKSAISRFGLVSSSLHSYTEQDVSAGSELTIPMVNSLITGFGQTLSPPFAIDRAKFFLELLISVLVNRGTDKVEHAGGCELTSSAGADKQFVTWSAVFTFFTGEAKRYGIKFVPRKLVSLCDDLFWEIWSDNQIKALDEYRRRGTRASRRWQLPDGTQPAAYVIVPDLFTGHLGPDELALRDKAQFAANVTETETTDSSYHGLDLDNNVEKQDLAAQAIKMRKLQLRVGAARRGGLGSVTSPREDPAMRDLYPDRY